MSILIVGSEGAQGKRYNAILKYLGVSTFRVDLGHQFGLIEAIKDKIDGIIIATPTQTHIDVIDNYLSLKKPILVEKPFSKDIEGIKALAKRATAPLSMVYQYQHLVDKYPFKKESYYNYFRHGNDGLIWDCLQIIGLSAGKTVLQETSPIWMCLINGRMLNIADMDRAYVLEIESWLGGTKKQTIEEVIDIHYKVADHEKACV